MFLQMIDNVKTETKFLSIFPVKIRLFDGFLLKLKAKAITDDFSQLKEKAVNNFYSPFFY